LVVWLIVSRAKSKRQIQKSGSDREGRSHCRLSIFIGFISPSRSDAVESAGAEQNRSPRRQIESYINAVDFHIGPAAQSRSRPSNGCLQCEMIYAKSNLMLRKIAMRLLRPTAGAAAFLIVAISIPPSLFSQTAPKPSQPKQPAPRQRRPNRSQRSDALAAAIKELLETKPLAPESPDEKASEGNASEDNDKPPADDAPIKELVNYWSDRYDDDINAHNPSDKVRQRLLEACEDRPELLDSLAHQLPENADTHDRLYKLLNEDPEDDNSWKLRLQSWLRRNSSYFRDELIEAAREAHDNTYVAHEDLRALARLDWNAARPILESLASVGKAAQGPIALTLLYEHAVQEGDSALVESYRRLMKATVENRQTDRTARLEALTGLMNSEWSGQEEWFISLFADPTLSDFREDAIEGAAESSASEGASGGELALTNIRVSALAASFRLDLQHGVLDTLFYRNTILSGDADRWVPVISNLIGHNQRIIHKAAVRCLVNFLINGLGDEKEKKEITQKLIPWLTEPDWATKEDRSGFIRSLVTLNMPELAPGLIQILDNDEDPNIRAVAAEALTKYRDARAIPALRRALEKEKSEENRQKIATALAECGGFSDDEMAAAIEAYARALTSDGFGQLIDSGADLPAEISIGRILNDSETVQATEGLAARLFERANALRATEPAVAREILRTIEGAPLHTAEINLVERIGKGWADVDSITLALEIRDTLMKSAGDGLYGLVKEGGYAAGVAASILNDEREWKVILENGDAKAQLALLACSRYLRDKLPVELAAIPLRSPNGALAKAAESYLEIEDSPEARKLILARHPGEAYIVGDLTAAGDDDTSIEAARSWEDELRKEMQSRSDLEAVYAVALIGQMEHRFRVIIRVRGGKVEMSVHETEGRRNVRLLTDREFDELKSFTSQQKIEDLGPENYALEDYKERLKYEYLRLTKEGGRRIFLDDLRRAPKNPTLHQELSGLFYRLSRSGEFTARYNIEDKIPGVEVVFADKIRSVLKVYGEGGEIRALIGEKGAEYRQGGAKIAPEWREFSSDKPGAVRDEPSACRKSDTPSSTPKDATVIHYNLFGRPAQSGGATYYQSFGEDVGIWKAEPGVEPVKIVSGHYNPFVITPDGKWLVTTKWLTEKEKTTQQLIRRNLQSGEEFIVSAPQNDSGRWLEYVAAHGKVLIGFHHAVGSGYLLDPESGTIQPVKGEFRPLLSTSTCAPQSAGGPNLFWAVIRDGVKTATKFGRYDSKKFAFAPLIDLPELDLSIDDIWVDATGGKIWFVYRGHLLRLPIPSQTK
jgi:hypothetical protein